VSVGKALMIQGCTSHAGKSYLTAAICRILSNRGVRVAPFKAQNMSNNAGVTRDGLEMGRAQIVQAAAARLEPQARMNPVLLKPEADTHSQVVVLGRADLGLSKLPWRERKSHLWGTVRESLHSLLHDFEVVVIEGAGSPSEVNLRASDIVNMSVALEAQARVLLVSDIDRGGSFAHLLGTWHCLSPEERALLGGFILNRFRGDASLLAPAPEWLEEQTGVPTLGVVPMLDIPLPEEDGVSLEQARSVALETEGRTPHVSNHVRMGETRAEARRSPLPGFVAIARLPRVSNLDEFAPLGNLARWVGQPSELEGARAIIIPGSKSTVADLDWLRASGLAGAISRLAREGVPVLGVCGGLQMLGARVRDPHGIEGHASHSWRAGDQGDIEGLGLLDLETIMEPEKITTRTVAHDLETHAKLEGYEIHAGRTLAADSLAVTLQNGAGQAIGWRQGNVRGVYVHGLLENPAYLEAFLNRAGLDSPGSLETLDARLDAIAARVKASLEWDRIEGMIWGTR
jgi:adenosylcobyric acid synthase